MTVKKKCLLLDGIGAAVSFLAPAAAAVGEFPRVERALPVSGMGLERVAEVFRLSATALFLLLLLFSLAAWRFFSHRLRMPRSGLGASLFLFLVSYGVEQCIHSFLVISFFSVLGSAVSAVLYLIADGMRRRERDGASL